MERKDIIRSVVQAADEFNNRRLWMRFANVHCFGVRFTDREEALLGVVMGAGREEFGLSLFRGPRAAAALTSLFHAGGMGDDALEDVDMLGFSMDAFGSLPPEGQDLMREADLHPRVNEPAPFFIVKPAGRRGRLPDISELTLLLLVLRAVIKADKLKQLQPATLDSREGISILRIGGGPPEPRVSVTREKWQAPEAPKTTPLPSDAADLRGLPILEETWLIGTRPAAARIQGDDRAMRMLLVVEEASEYVLEGRGIFAGDLQESVEAILAAFRKGPDGRKGLPRRIVFSNRKLLEALTPLVEPLGIQCTFQAVIPKLQEIADGFREYMGVEAPPSGVQPEPVQSPDAVPAPDDLQGWKQADSRLIRRFVQYLQSGDRLRSTRAVRRYFIIDDLERFLKKHQNQLVEAAYAAWGVLDYRPTKNSKTHAEIMLEKGLPAAEAILLRARMEAYPTLYRVAGHDPTAGTVDLEDVLLGGKVTIHDQMMSKNIEDGLFFCARAFPAGRFYFLDPAGPPLGAGMGMEAVEHLRDSGMKFTREGLRRDAHKFGWLWRWIEEWEANWRPPQLCNTDGDELLWHTASFSVADPARTRQVLLERPDLMYDEEEDDFEWFRETGKAAQMLTGPVTLGQIQLVDDELVLSVNSARRFATARRWLEELPGVVFRNVETRPWDQQEQDRPMDERMPPEPVEMMPEVVEAVQEMLDKHYMNWIDAPVPALGGLTPREACRTEAGRQQVLMMIRTAPDPSGPASIRVPREAVLRELGLSTEPAVPPSAESSPEAKGPGAEPSASEGPRDQSLDQAGKDAAPDEAARAPSQVGPPPPGGVDDSRGRLSHNARGPQVSRNAPCPCGSGRKYKKCCGRTQP